MALYRRRGGAVSGKSRQPALSDAEMRQMWKTGDPLSEIAAKARKRNGIGRADVRRIIFGGTQ
jgi:hypothetical protein